MLDDSSMAALLEAYVAETEEGLIAAEQALLELERAPRNADAVAALFRVVHTIKGNAGIFDFASVVALAHAMEDLLDRVRRGQTVPTARLVTLLLRSLDALRNVVRDSIAAPRDLGRNEKALIRALRKACAERTAEQPDPAEETHGSPVAALQSPGTHDAHRTLRVDVSRLDRLLDLSGEIGIARGRVGQLLEDGDSPRRAILEAHRDAMQLHLEMQELVMKLRMVPVGPMFRQLLRTVRDTAQALGKEAELVIEGEDVEVDMSIVEQLKDPLMHIVRNSIDHGIELPAARAAAGKPARGRLLLRSFRDSGSIVIQLEDDGSGLDRARITERAIRQGLVSGDQALSDVDVCDLLFRPGFSTADHVSDVSGRGVGLDVVRRNIEAIHGSVMIESDPGCGTTTRMRLPLTLAIIDGLQVGVAGESYIIPMEAVVEALDFPALPAWRGAATGLLTWRGEDIPFIRMRDRLTFRHAPRTPAREHAVVVRWGEHGRAALVVDALLGECQTVVKPLAKILQGVTGISGSAILPSGSIAFITDVAGLLQSESRRAQRRRYDGAANGLDPRHIASTSSTAIPPTVPSA